MADKLTQLQDAYDQLLDRMYATLLHISTYHTYGSIADQSDENPHGVVAAERRRRAREEEVARLRKDAESRRKQIKGEAEARQERIGDRETERRLTNKDNEELEAFDAEVNRKLQDEGGLPPEDPAVFQRNLDKFSRDLMLKYTQIEVLIENLPALNLSQADQEDEIRRLEQMVREKEREKAMITGERRDALDKLNKAILNIRRL